MELEQFKQGQGSWTLRGGPGESEVKSVEEKWVDSWFGTGEEGGGRRAIVE